MAVEQRCASQRVPGNDQDKVTSTWSGRTLKFNQQTSAEMRTRGLSISKWCVRVCRFKNVLVILHSVAYIFIHFHYIFPAICFHLFFLKQPETLSRTILPTESKCPKWWRNHSFYIYFHFLSWSSSAFSSIQMSLPQNPNIFFSIICSLCRNTSCINEPTWTFSTSCLMSLGA